MLKIWPVIREAFYIARTGRPGPVLVDLPADVQRASTEFIWPEKIEIRSYKPTFEGHIGQIKKAAELINQAARPILYAGGGVIIAGATKELRSWRRKGASRLPQTLMGSAVSRPIIIFIWGCWGCTALLGEYGRPEHRSDYRRWRPFDDRVTEKFRLSPPKAKLFISTSTQPRYPKMLKPMFRWLATPKNILTELLKHVQKKLIRTG